MSRFAEHPLRYILHNEVHARPFERLGAPARISHLALLSDEAGSDRDREHLAALCGRHGLPAPGPEAIHYSAEFGDFRLKWERHSEFATYTVFREGLPDDPFSEPAIGPVPADWLADLPGQLLVAIHLAVEARETPERRMDQLGEFFVPDSLTGSVMAGGAAIGWTDFRIHEDGFSRFLVRDVNLRSRQAGRLVQRLLEIETYRNLSLLALPLAREAGSVLFAMSRELGGINDRMTSVEGLEDEEAMLGNLTRLSAGLERLMSRNAYRFSAARAYYALVETRIAELREKRIEGMQSIGEFMDRRMVPALRTCEATAARQDRLADRLARATAMLRARVDIALEAQNRDLLRSMNRRAKLQLRLQETVEGLSVAAITYYLVGLVGYAAKGIYATGFGVPVDLVTGLSIPLVLTGVWLAMRGLRRRLGRGDGVGD